MLRLRAVAILMLLALALVAASSPSSSSLASSPQEVRVRGGESLPKQTRELIAAAARADAGELSRRYGAAYNRDFTVYLPGTVEEFARIGGAATPAEAIGYADPSRDLVVVSPAVWKGEPWRVGTVLLVEISHLVLDEKLGLDREELPHWLDEGLSTDAALDWSLARGWPSLQRDRLTRYRFLTLTLWQSISGSRQQELATRAALRRGDLPSLAGIDGLFSKDTSDVRLAYAASYSFMHYLTRSHGEGARIRLLGALEGGADIDTSFRLAFGKGLAALEKDWRASLLEEGWPFGMLSTLAQLLVTLTVVVFFGVLLALGVIRYRRRGPYSHARRMSHLLIAIIVTALLLGTPTAGAATQTAGTAGRDAPPVSVKAESEIPAAYRSRISAVVFDRAAALSVAYRHSYERPVTVLLAARSDRFPRVGAAGDVLAVARPAEASIVVSPKSWRGDPKGLDGVLAHEVSHLVLGDKFAQGGAPLPRWLDEGLAQYVAGTWDFDLDWAGQRERTMRAAVASRSLLPISSLEPAFNDPDSLSLAYAESYGFVQYLSVTFGRQRLERFVDRASSSPSVEEAAEAALGRSFGDVEKEWRAQLIGDTQWWQLLLDDQTFLVLLWSVLAALVVLGFLLNSRRKRRAYERMEEDDARWDYREVSLDEREADDRVPE
ncbi:MAG: hypothetical protein C4521_10685 [Actinobacteria bacterium]|nr:MAG: hypothetical protein C4521_10685 [Actinomycetota bacterium]